MITAAIWLIAFAFPLTPRAEAKPGVRTLDAILIFSAAILLTIAVNS